MIYITFQIFDSGSRSSNKADLYTEVILESGASVELVPKVTKVETQLLEQLKADSVKDSEDNKFVVSVKHIIFKYSLNNVYVCV